ncbi:MAG TPA: hypothetical protein PKE69_10295 [Pyrinomonadaceae bacterium]|nr:hypothetical protein [Pyrinomonadaceae bacterium]
MGLLRFIFRGAKEAIEEQSAKSDLEKKLGRKVSEEELYSLGSHLDAAGENTSPQPLKITQRESATPFADAKPPIKLRNKLLLFGILLLIIGFLVGGFVIQNMSKQTYNRLNPFTPKPPEGVFPAKVGDYSLAQKPDYYEPSSYKPTPSFGGEYKKDGEKDVRYNVTIFNSEAEAAEAYDKIKNTIKDSQHGKVVEKSDNRIAFAGLSGWDSNIYFKDGKYLKMINSFAQKPTLDFEGFLKNAAPQAMTMLDQAELKENLATAAAPTVTVQQLLDDYKKDSGAADKKYEGKIIRISGAVEVSDRDKSGKWMIAFMRPGSTKPTDGMVVASFEKAKESSVTSVKKGDNVTLQCKVGIGILMNVMLEKCSKP